MTTQRPEPLIVVPTTDAGKEERDEGTAGSRPTAWRRRGYEALSRYGDDLARQVHLRSSGDTNEVVFYGWSSTVS
jgi:hypothetical protein